jgi:hypothetical protein
MFNFSKTEAPRKLNRDFILSKISDAQIFGYYFGNFKFAECYPSKFRKDKHPSTGFYVSSSGKLIYNDMARRNEAYDCFAFVSKMYNLDFSDTIKKIAADFGLVTGKPSLMAEKAIRHLKNFDKTFKAETKISFDAAKITDENFAFWKAYHITKKEFRDDQNYVIKNLCINGYVIPAKEGEHRYALTETIDGVMHTKIYSPYSSNFKWVTNIPTEVPFGLKSLGTASRTCFVAKAKKDRLVLRKFLPNVIAVQSEQRSAMPDKVIKKLKFRYDRLYMGADNDETGIEYMNEMSEFGFIPAGLPEEWNEQSGIKDYSDLGKEWGLGAVEKYLKQQNII